jgi:hypothetical protein
MPLFFVISGVAAYPSLARRSASQFARDRLERLIIPFVFGLFFVLPVNVYYDVVFHGYFVGDFVSFYLGPYFTKAFPFSVNFSPTYFADSNQGVYLWYLFWLFVFSIVTVQFFKWLAKEGNRNKFSKLHATCNRRGGILLLAVPLLPSRDSSRSSRSRLVVNTEYPNRPVLSLNLSNTRTVRHNPKL